MISKILDLLLIRSQHHRVAKNHGFNFSSSRGQNIFSATQLNLFLWHSWIKNFPYATALFLNIEKVIR